MTISPRLPGLLGIILIVLCALPGLASARNIVVEDSVEKLPLDIAINKPLTIAFKSTVLSYWKPEGWKVVVNDEVPDQLTITAPKNIRPEQVEGLVIVFARLYTLHLVIQPAASKDAGEANVVVYHKDTMQVIQTAIDARVQIEVEKATKAIEAKAAEDGRKKDEKHAKEIATERQENERLRTNRDRIVEQALAHAIQEGYDIHPLEGATDCAGNGIVICGTGWGRGRKDGMLGLTIINNRHSEVEGDALEVFSKVENSPNRAGGVSVKGSDEPFDGVTRIKLPALGRVDLSVVVHEPATVGDSLYVVLKGPSGVLAAEWVGLKPKPRKKITLSAYGAYGAAWLAEGSGENRTDATSLETLGARVAYSANEQSDVSFSLEAALGVAWTGNSQFSSAIVDGVQGDLERSALLGRLQVGGVLRLGKTIRPTVRLGVGAQLASIDSSFVPASGGMSPMESSSIEFGVFLAAGAGVDVWIGEALLLGIGLGFETPLGNVQDDALGRSVGVGLHLGFAWEPSSN